jgi:isopenicillin N synthase-like dioxygenase
VRTGWLAGWLAARRRALLLLLLAATMTSSPLPIIDFSPFTAPALPGRDIAAAQRAVAEQTHAAFSTLGFCYAAGHGVDPALLSRVFAAAEAFFALPQAEKEQIAVERSPSRSRGYQRLGQNVTQGANDAHEGFDIMRELPRDHSLVVDAAIHHGDCNQWPAAAPELRKILDEYVAAMSTAGAAIMQAVAMGLGLSPTFFSEYYSEGFWIARMIRYPVDSDELEERSHATPSSSLPSQAVVKAAAAEAGAASRPAPPHVAPPRDRRPPLDVGCGEHTDYGCLTMVAADSTPGCLQVRGPDGSCERAKRQATALPRPLSTRDQLTDIGLGFGIGVPCNNRCTALHCTALHSTACCCACHVCVY